MAQVRWLLVGAGDIARKRVAPALATANGSVLTGICNPNAARLTTLADEYGVAERYTDIGTALASTTADAVYLATPVWLHVEQAVQALAAGKHVLIEKPLGLSADDCARLLQAAARNDRKIACAYYRRFSPRFRHAQQMLADGEFGRIVAMRIVYHSWFAPAPDDPKYWRVQREKSGGGPLSDMGCHMFDLLIGLFGMPATVFARCAHQVRAWNVEDGAAVLMTLHNGALVTASVHWNSPVRRHEMEIVGTKACLLWRPFDSGPVQKTVGDQHTALELPPADNVHLPLVEDFVDAIAQDRPPRFSLAESARANRLLDAIYRSSAEGQEVVISPEETSR